MDLGPANMLSQVLNENIFANQDNLGQDQAFTALLLGIQLLLDSWGM